MNETTDASALFAPIWRRKWLILAVAILVAGGTYLYYRHKSASYEATTQVYLGAGAEEQITSSGVPSVGGRKSGLEPSAQATLINSPIIKSEVRKQLRKQRKNKAARQALKGKVKAKAREKNEFLTITSEARSRRGAALLADLTAQTYVRRQNGNYRRTLEGAIALARRQIRRLDANQEAAAAAEAAKAAAKGAKGTAPPSTKGTTTSNSLQIANLASKLNQMEGNLGIQSVKQVSPAVPKKLSSSPKRTAIFGFLIGLLLASLLAYVLARFDSRLRTLAEIETAFGAEILTALPAVRRPLVATPGGPRPSRILYEPLGRLQTSLQAAAPARQNGQPARARTVLFTSAESGDGQSTVIAGLALVERDAGASVAVVEADLRRPDLARLLGVAERPGLVEVLTGQLAIGEAAQGIGSGLTARAPDPAESVGTPTQVAVQAPPASASVLVGTAVENPSALLAHPAMAHTVQTLAGMYEHVLIDAPPPLEVGDAIALLSIVDAIVVVARAGQSREASARRLIQTLSRMSDAPVLGVVANGVSAKDSRRYGFSGYRAVGWRGRLGG
jgi:Mrp family chromosome partitioning ATPase